MSQPTLSYEPATLKRAPGPWLFASGEGRQLLESEILPKWLPTRRWFGGKARSIHRVGIEAGVSLDEGSSSFLAVAVHYAGHSSDRYLVPLAWGPQSEFDSDKGVVARDDSSNVVSDAVFSPAFRARLLDLIASDGKVGEAGHAISGKSGEYLRAIPRETLSDSQLLGVEQSNTSVIYGGKLFLKMFRRLDAGINPDAEITRYLTEQQGFDRVPPYAGELEARLGNNTYSAGLMLGCVENRGDAWSWALKVLGEYYSGIEPREAFERIAQLGRDTAEMHRALAAASAEPAFQPEPLTQADFDELAASVTARLQALLPVLQGKKSAGDALAGEVVAQEDAIRQSIAALRTLPAGAAKTRHHGDYHLGQVLAGETDWVIIDFEGEPTRSLSERRAKRSPLRDVAGMLRSFHYAAHSACPAVDPDGRKRAEVWTDGASAAFLDRYLQIAEGAVFLPNQQRDQASLLRAYVLEKALYEIDYELNNRPDWLPIPMRGLLRALSQ